MQFLAGRRAQLLKQKGFSSYLLVCFLSTFGSGLSYIISNWLILEVRNDVTTILVMMVCFWLPNALLGPYWGVLVDRYSRKHLLLWSNVARAVILFGFTLYFNFYPLSVHNLDVFMLLMGSMFGVIWPASVAMIREIVPMKDLLYANSLVDIVYEIGNVMGMGSAGFILAGVSPTVAFGITGGMFVLAALAMLPVQTRYKTAEKGKKRERISNEFVLGLQYLSSDKKLMLIYVIQLTIIASFMIAPVLIAPFAKNILGADEIQFGIIEAGLSIGMITGGLAIPWVAETWGLNRALFYLICGMAIFYILFSFNTSIIVAIFLYFAIGFVLSAWPLIVTKAQEITLLDYQGRVQSVFSSISSVVVVITYILIAISSHIISLRWLYVFPTLLALVALYLIAKLRKIEGN
jgi:MFS family permease